MLKLILAISLIIPVFGALPTNLEAQCSGSRGFLGMRGRIANRRGRRAARRSQRYSSGCAGQRQAGCSSTASIQPVNDVNLDYLNDPPMAPAPPRDSLTLVTTVYRPKTPPAPISMPSLLPPPVIDHAYLDRQQSIQVAVKKPAKPAQRAIRTKRTTVQVCST